MLEVAKQLQGRYSCLQEIDRITRETQDAFSRNDTESARLLLSMRGECMDKADGYREKAEKLLYALDREEAKILLDLMHERAGADDFPEQCRKEAGMIADVSGRSRKLLGNIIKRDQVMNRRITGKKSYYQKED